MSTERKVQAVRIAAEDGEVLATLMREEEFSNQEISVRAMREILVGIVKEGPDQVRARSVEVATLVELIAGASQMLKRGYLMTALWMLGLEVEMPDVVDLTAERLGSKIKPEDKEEVH